MEYSVLVAGFLVAFGTTALLTPIVRRLAIDQDWVDQPDGHRKLHVNVVPAVGGIAIAFGFAFGLAYLHAVRTLLPFEVQFPPAALWAGGLVIVASGFYDDVRGLGFKGKLAVQIVVAYALLHAGYRIDVAWVPFISDDLYSQALLSIPLTLLWIVGVINAVNLLDGLDGLAAGVSLIAFASLGLVFGLNGEVGLVMIALVATGALAGFLLFNFNPASIFMGDSGSLFLGYLLATYTLAGTGHANPWVALALPAVALGLPLVDTALSIARRFFERKSICAPDRDHIHHRLTRTLSHRDAVLVLYAVALSFGVAALLMSVLPPMLSLVVIVFVCALTGLGLNSLKYLRRSYVEPDILPFGMARSGEFGERVPLNDDASAEARELRGSSKDGDGQVLELGVGKPTEGDQGSGGDYRASSKVARGNRGYNVSGAAS
jgi:UDP-GlcNAc:undecaprenyl-phosphate GlcNAc-1-phosphate transferase